MTAEATTTTSIPVTGTEPAPAETPPPAEKPNDIKALEAALRKANKEAEQHRLKLKEIEDRDKTEAQRATEALLAAEKRAEEAEKHAIRLAVIAEVGLDPDLHEFVVGDTEDEMRAKAEKLKVKAAAAAQPTGVRPIDQGTRSSADLALNGDPLLRDLKAKLGIPQ